MSYDPDKPLHPQLERRYPHPTRAALVGEIVETLLELARRGDRLRENVGRSLVAVTGKLDLLSARVSVMEERAHRQPTAARWLTELTELRETLDGLNRDVRHLGERVVLLESPSGRVTYAGLGDKQGGSSKLDDD